MKKIVAILMAMMMVISVTVALAGGADKETQTNFKKVIVGFDESPNKADEKMIRDCGGKTKYTYHIIKAKAVEIPEQAIENIKKNPRVEYVEEDGIVQAVEEEVIPWGVDRIDADLVWSANKGTGVKVAIIDTGIDKDHLDLQANIKGGSNFVSNHHRRPADPDKWDDDNGHGTHCAGIVAAVDNEVGVIGVAPEAYLYGVKVLDMTGSGYESDVIAGIEWSRDNGMQVISMSLSSSRYSAPLHEACDNAYYDAGIVVVAAAGNSGPGDDTVNYPAKYESVIAVSATDDKDTIAPFSSTGPDVELAAPGVSIYSTYRGGGYATISGTSMACPHVAGTAALAIGEGNVRQYLQDTAEDLGVTGKDNLYGYGLVNADEAVMPTEPNIPPVADAGAPYTGTEDVAITFDGSGSDDPEGDSLTYAWDFGDGSTGTGVNPTHTYTAGGTYTVSLVVNDGKADSETSTTTATITGVNDPPVAEAGSDQNAIVGGVVTFDGSGSYDIDGTITDYAWEFGDGSTGTCMTTTHTYETARTYSAVLTVTDNDGLTSTDTAIVIVTEEVPANTMHIGSIVMSTDSKTRGRNTFVWAVATVTIVNATGSSLEGATVSGQWSGLTSDSDAGVTDANGNVALKSDRVKDATGTFTFTVDTVTKDGWEYDPEANGVDPPSGSIPV